MVKVIYHANCTDGAGAALAAYRTFGDAADYIPAQHGSEPPDVSDCEVYIVDFSYKKTVLLEMAATARSITVIDHHKTAQEDLRDISRYNIEVIFDMRKSGAVLTWEYFHPTIPVPFLLQVIQDRDLWLFKSQHTKEITAGLQIYPDWRTWLDISVDRLRTAGRAIADFLVLQSEKIIQSPPRHWDIENIVIPLYNMPGFLISDTLCMALEKYPECPYAVAYFDLPDNRIYSLRSRSGSDVDVSEIAKKHGGGGHKHAAGFSVGVNK